MTTNRLTAIVLLSALVAWLWKLASAPRATVPAGDRDLLLLGLDEDGAYALGYTQGLNGIAGYWPDYERTAYDDVPGVGIVWRASPQESAYWRGWYAGEEDRDRANA